MLRKLRARLTYANVMATIAVFGVLAGGGAYAASQIGASDIERNAVRSKHIKRSAVRAADLANPTLFAYISDEGSGNTATVAYGKGVTRVDDQAGNASYVVTFSRSVVRCAISVVPGNGNPGGSGIPEDHATPSVSMDNASSRDVLVEFNTNEAASATDSAFLIALFC